MPLERLTMLIVPRVGQVSMVVPRLEVPRVVAQPEVFSIVPWNETDNPIAIVAKLLGDAKRIAVGDQMWARFLVELLPHVPGATFTRAVDVVGVLRMSKDASEIAALRTAGAAADRVAAQLHAGKIPLIGRTEAAVSADISARLIANEIVLCDFGGTMNGYCSDITRCVFTGQIASDVADAYAVLFESQAAGVAAGVVGNACEDVDRASRAVIEKAGYGEYFVHRTGHGIGMEAHEDPYMVSGNKLPIAAGHAFSVEPGIYIPGKWGMRLEDIVVATMSGPDSMNAANHNLIVVEA
jgi:Xaa-Pro aminopeptidase